MVEATFEDLAITTLFGRGTASLSPFQRSPSGFTASPSRASLCDQRGIPPWNPQQRFSRRCCSSRESDAQAVLQLIKWEIFNKNIPFYGNIGVYSTGYALDSSVFWPFYPILLSDSELQHSLCVRFPRRTGHNG